MAWGTANLELVTGTIGRQRNDTWGRLQTEPRWVDLEKRTSVTLPVREGILMAKRPKASETVTAPVRDGICDC